MADVSYVSYQLTDHKGDRATLPVFFPATATLAQIQAASDTIAAELDAVTGCQITAARVALDISLPAGIKASPTANLDLEKGANYGFDAQNTDYRHTMRVPAIPSLLVDGDNVKVSEQDVIDFRDAILNGDGVTAPTDRYANDLTSLLSAVVTFRGG